MTWPEVAMAIVNLFKQIVDFIIGGIVVLFILFMISDGPPKEPKK